MYGGHQSINTDLSYSWTQKGVIVVRNIQRNQKRFLTYHKLSVSQKTSTLVEDTLFPISQADTC